MTAPITLDLLALYREPQSAVGVDLDHWTDLLGAMRRARCMGAMATRLREVDVLARLPAGVQGQFETAWNNAHDRRHLLRWELSEIARCLAGLGAPVVALKGAAYELQGLPMAQGRLPNDIDLMVPVALLAQAESRMKQGGWLAVELDPYDERYYRDWSHEIPPMHHPEREIEVDLHHAISPSTKGPRIDPAMLLERARPCGRFAILDPLDQILHCAVHTFKDSDLGGRLREVMDLDALVRQFGTGGARELSDRIWHRAAELGVIAEWRLASRTARRWLATPLDEAPLDLPADAAALVRSGAGVGQRGFDALLDAAMMPDIRQQPGTLGVMARTAMLARYHWKRMPVRRLVPHLLEKSRRRWVPGR